MRQVSEEQQAVFKEDLDRNAADITETLEKIANNDWIQLGSTANTVKRLKRKGHRSEADQYIRFEARLGKEIDLERIDPKNKEELSPIRPEQINQIVKEGIVGSDDMISSYFLHKGSSIARSVGRISNKNTREALGTGFLISPNLILSNNHVIPSKAFAANCIIEFDFYADHSGNPIKANEFELQADVLFLTSPEQVFDFTIIAIQAKNVSGVEVKQFGWIQMIEETGKAHIGERLNIIHHPQGKPQHISIRKNLLVTHEESKVYLKYMTDTEPGSSGSPVLNDEWELVALHRASQIITKDAQKKLYFQAMRQIDENLALELMKNNEVTINFGVRISTIANYIKTQIQHFPPKEQQLLEEIFKRERDRAFLPIMSLIGRPEGEEQIAVSAPQVAISEEAATIKQAEEDAAPINININIGNKNHSLPALAAPIASTPLRATDQALQTQLEIYNNKINSQQSVFKAFTFLEEARAKSYLPKQDEIERLKNDYYEEVLQELDNGGLSKKQLYDKLHTLLANTLTLVDKFPAVTTHLESLILSANLESFNLEGSGGITYTKARAHLYTWVDLQEDRMLKGVYTQAPISPEQLLLKDLIQSLKIEGIKLPKRYNNNQFLNCEHIVPKSLFNNDHLGFSDLHHLITAEGATNTFRNNRPYRQFRADEGRVGPRNLVEYIAPGGKTTTKYFEPFHNKALVARATLYFIVCHKQKLSKTVYDAAAIQTLIDWSNSEAPSRYELHRNESIFELQGNRNPFIDFPSWVEKVDFMQGLME